MLKLMVRTVVLCAFALTALAPQVFAGPAYSGQKVVYHFNQNNLKTTAGGLRNLQNHINAVGEMNLKAVAVFHGGGVFTLLQNAKDPKDKEMIDKIHSRVMSLKQQGVAFNICSNTLKGKKLDYGKDLFDVKKQDIVPSGVAEISKLQAEGYTYIKP